jgi:hypothetical protein
MIVLVKARFFAVLVTQMTNGELVTVVWHDPAPSRASGGAYSFSLTSYTTLLQP